MLGRILIGAADGVSCPGTDERNCVNRRKGALTAVAAACGILGCGQPATGPPRHCWPKQAALGLRFFGITFRWAGGIGSEPCCVACPRWVGLRSEMRCSVRVVSTTSESEMIREREMPGCPDPAFPPSDALPRSVGPAIADAIDQSPPLTRHDGYLPGQGGAIALSRRKTVPILA